MAKKKYLITNPENKKYKVENTSLKLAIYYAMAFDKFKFNVNEYKGRVLK